MRTLVVGTGGVGGYFGAKLVRAGHEVAMTARGANLVAIRANGLTIQSPHETVVVRPTSAAESPRGLGPFDLVLVGVKAQDTAAALAGTRAELAPDAIVLSLQNGMDGEEGIETALEIPPILVSTAYVGVELVAPGVVRHASGNTLVIGERDDRRSARLDRLVASLEAAAIDVVVPKNIRLAKWQKLAWNASFNLICALSGATIGGVVAHPDSRALAIASMQEIAACAAAEGTPFEPDHVDKQIRLAEERHPAVRPSTMQDREKGKPLEHEALTGFVVRFGAEHGVPTPVSATLDALARLVSRAEA